MSYYLAPALLQLRAEVDRRWPGRDRASDGWIGDTAHSARKSDHNPDYDAGGVVRAIDIDKDGIDVTRLLLSLVGSPRVAYIIWQGRIWQNPAIYSVGGWQAYSGSNSHHQHVHVSIRRGYESGTYSWGVLDAPTPADQEDDDMVTRQELVTAIDPAYQKASNAAESASKAHVVADAANRAARAALEEQRKAQIAEWFWQYGDGTPATTAQVDEWYAHVTADTSGPFYGSMEKARQHIANSLAAKKVPPDAPQPPADGA